MREGRGEQIAKEERQREGRGGKRAKEERQGEGQMEKEKAKEEQQEKEREKEGESMILRGSLTVEATCLMGLVLLVVTTVLYLFFFVHNRAYLTCAAYEAALSGSLAALSEDAASALSEAEQRMAELSCGSFYGAEGLSSYARVEPSLTGLTIVTGYEAETHPLFGLSPWYLQVEARVGVLYPVKWIRNTKAASDLLFQSD